MIRRVLVAFIFLAGTILLALLTTHAEEDYGRRPLADGSVTITSHDLDVWLDTERNEISGSDSFTLSQPVESVEFTLHRNLEVSAVRTEDDELLLAERVSIAREDDEGVLATWRIHAQTEGLKFKVVRLRFCGEIYDPVHEEAALAHVRGDFTSGIIAPEGIYLDAGSGWYPEIDGSLATFALRVETPMPMLTIAQGDLVARTSFQGRERSEWQSEIPQDGLTLVGNEFVEKSHQVNGVTIATYFFEEDAPLADKFLDATEKYLEFYTNLLGEFPYNRFDIVENFFQTGYGMPGYTLLGDRVIKMSGGGGYDVTGPSGIAHEMMHNWWGNFVFFDADKGNWCEAITTYLTNYYWLEASGQEEEALKWRKHASVKYSINAPPDRAYPLIEFRGKQNEVDGAVGYEKGAMFFHYLRQLLGDDAFFAGLRQVIREHGGDFATWDDFRDAFKAHAPEQVQQTVNLDEVFQHWLTRPDAPDFWIESAGNELNRQTGDWTFAARFRQAQPYWALKLAFSLEDEDGKLLAEGLLQMNDRESSFSVTGPKPYPTCIVELDPEWHMFRQVPLSAQEPCLNLVMNDPTTIVVYPSAKDAMSDELTKLVEVIEASGRELTIISDTEFKLEMLADHSLFILGGGSANSAWEQVRELVPMETFTANPRSFTIGRKVYDAKGMSVLATFTHPRSRGKFISIYHGNSVEALARARYIFFYGWDSFVVFQGGRLMEREMLPPLTNPWRREVKSARFDASDARETTPLRSGQS